MDNDEREDDSLDDKEVHFTIFEENGIRLTLSISEKKHLQLIDDAIAEAFGSKKPTSGQG